MVGADLSKFVGKFVTITGKIDTSATPADGAAAVVDVQNSKKPGGGGWSSDAKTAVISGVVVAASVGVGVGIYEYESNQPSTPASR